MNQSKIESDISYLEDSILKEEYEIILVENQLETKELNADGSDEYFDWRKRAITAINMKRARKNSMKRQLSYWREILKKTKSENNIQLKREGLINQEKIREEKAAKRSAHLFMSMTKVEKEKEKTKRHKASEAKDVKIGREFRKIIKALIGEEKYLDATRLAEINFNNSTVNNH